MTALEVKNLHKSYSTQPVLRGVDLSVEEGDFVAILGPSGSGKTTLLRVIAGFERADRGSVCLRGEIVDDGVHHVPAERRRIGYVPQEGSLFPHLTVAQNVRFGLERRQRHSSASQVRELIEMVGLVGFGRRYPHQLSGGQQQRVALARALAIHPTIVLLDEPFSSLDASLRASVRTDVQRVLKEAGTTALLVTHDQDEALSLADRVAVIRHGQIGQYDTPQGLYTHPLDLGLARALGEVNLVPASADGSTLTTPLGTLVAEGRTFPPHTEVIAAVRPEQIELCDPAEATLTGRVIDFEYYGHDAVLRVHPDGGLEVPVVVRTIGTTGALVRGERVGMRAGGVAPAFQKDDDRSVATR